MKILDGGKIWNTDQMEKIANKRYYVGCGISFPEALYRLPDGSFVLADLDEGSIFGIVLWSRPFKMRPVSIARAMQIVENNSSQKRYRELFGEPPAAFSA